MRRVILLWALTLAAFAQRTPSPDRTVAEWMLRMGGSVVLDGQTRPVRDLTDLPDGPFRIHTLNFSGVTQWASNLEDELKKLPALPHLKAAYINGRLWYDQSPSLVATTIGLLAQSPGLEKLIISKPVQTYIPLDDDTSAAIKPLSGLKELRMHQTKAPGPNLASFPNLIYLDLNYDRTFNDEGMAALSRMPGLTKLYLRGTGITDAGVVHLSNLTHLTELDLSDTGIGDAGLRHLGEAHRTAPPQPANRQPSNT